MTTLNKRKVPLSPRTNDASRSIRKISQPSRKSDDPKKQGFFNRPRLGGKSIWDWMQLLIIPFVLTVGGLLYSNYQHNVDQQTALDQQQATILQTYIDNIQDLLLNHNLLGTSPKPKNDTDKALIQEVQDLAKARTVTAVQRLDPDRKGILLQFLYTSGLITVDKVVVSLDKVDLSGIRISDVPDSSINVMVQNYMPGIDLQGANLNLADLQDMNFVNANLAFTLLQNANLSQDWLNQAYLSGSDLEHSNLSGAELSNAYLNGTSLVGANLSGADLSGADLRYAILAYANLKGARGITQKQLNAASSLRGATMPDGSIHP